MKRAFSLLLVLALMLSMVPETFASGLPVVFVDQTVSDSGDGSTKETALNDLSEAVAMLRNSGGTIVIVGNYLIPNSDSWSSAKEYRIYGGSSSLTITGKYGGVDYEGKILTGGKALFTTEGRLPLRI